MEEIVLTEYEEMIIRLLGNQAISKQDILKKINRFKIKNKVKPYQIDLAIERLDRYEIVHEMISEELIVFSAGGDWENAKCRHPLTFTGIYVLTENQGRLISDQIKKSKFDDWVSVAKYIAGIVTLIITILTFILSLKGKQEQPKVPEPPSKEASTSSEYNFRDSN